MLSSESTIFPTFQTVGVIKMNKPIIQNGLCFVKFIDFNLYSPLADSSTRLFLDSQVLFEHFNFKQMQI